MPFVAALMRFLVDHLLEFAVVDPEPEVVKVGLAVVELGVPVVVVVVFVVLVEVMVVFASELEVSLEW